VIVEQYAQVELLAARAVRRRHCEALQSGRNARERLEYERIVCLEPEPAGLEPIRELTDVVA
jgi:hypothetical protein